MGILPTNTRQRTVDVPKNFFIFGATMSGKSYLAEHFPAPLFLNTDGNALANPFPNIQLKNVKDRNGNLKQSVLEDLDAIMEELQSMNNNPQFQYKTIIVDVVDDICELIKQAICIKAEVSSLSEIGYGKGFDTFNTIINDFILNLKSLGLNVVYISRVEYVTDSNDESKTLERPSLKTKYFNMFNGNCDLVIQTKKIRNNYHKIATDIRKKYFIEDIKDKKILSVLSEIPGALYHRPQPKQQTQEQPKQESK